MSIIEKLLKIKQIDTIMTSYWDIGTLVNYCKYNENHIDYLIIGMIIRNINISDFDIDYIIKYFPQYNSIKSCYRCFYPHLYGEKTMENNYCMNGIGCNSISSNPICCLECINKLSINSWCRADYSRKEIKHNKYFRTKCEDCLHIYSFLRYSDTDIKTITKSKSITLDIIFPIFEINDLKKIFIDYLDINTLAKYCKISGEYDYIIIMLMTRNMEMSDDEYKQFVNIFPDWYNMIMCEFCSYPHFFGEKTQQKNETCATPNCCWNNKCAENIGCDSDPNKPICCYDCITNAMITSRERYDFGMKEATCDKKCDKCIMIWKLCMKNYVDIWNGISEDEYKQRYW